MSNFFQHDYIVPNQHRFLATVLCLRCSKIIRSERVRIMKMRGSTEMGPVVDSVVHNDYRLVPLEIERNGVKRMTHIPVCADCVSFPLTEQVKPLILSQIIRGEIMSAEWSGYPKELSNAIQKRWSETKILRRLEGEALENAYLGTTVQAEV